MDEKIKMNDRSSADIGEGHYDKETTMTEPMPMCPMAETCKGIMKRRRSGLTLWIPGIVFIVLGLIVLAEPRILVWLVAIALIVMGIAMMMFARMMRRMSERFSAMHNHP